MRIFFVLIPGALLICSGCDSTQPAAKTPASSPTTANRPSYDSAAAKSTATSSTDKPGTAGPSTAEPDNTAVNERDRNGATKTPIDQDENQRDVTLTAEIRKAVLARENMSVNARNVKIITSQGKVTLRGPVNSEDEKKAIDAIATDLAGKDNVTNEIEVKSEE